MTKTTKDGGTTVTMTLPDGGKATVTPGDGGSTLTPGDAPTNGSRLTAVPHGTMGSDGSKYVSYYGWHDTQLDLDCAFSAANGSTYCLPSAGFAGSTPSGIYYLDSACTQAGAFVGVPPASASACGSMTPTYVSVTDSTQCPAVTTIHNLGAQLPGIWLKSGTMCYSESSAGYTYYGVGAQADLSKFVSGSTF